MSELPVHLAELTTERLREVLDGPTPCVALVPVGSVEPHGPHLPLATDTVISEVASARAAARLRERGSVAFVAPSIPYGVTRFAEGFAGAITVPAETLTAFVRAVVLGYHAAGFAHVCLVNNHLEPEHDAALRAAVDSVLTGSVTLASPLTRRWARTLSDEFKSGACHAGRYETSLMLAAAPKAVDVEAARALPDLDMSLSTGIQEGKKTFRELGMDRAYTGSPAAATAREGHEQLDRLADMIVGEVEGALTPRDTMPAPEPR